MYKEIINTIIPKDELVKIIIDYMNERFIFTEDNKNVIPLKEIYNEMKCSFFYLGSQNRKNLTYKFFVETIYRNFTKNISSRWT